ncbi:hypothetical protein LSM04_006244 [Trypanosoma melophagium]|uniref:uncharacterized protein n=1 Tax=Trypanosoma melophagium TaxID=715481 RepID=UPI00351A7730|nr:hypothetical protein LSM04_006244 [Trypanosoma melophagium]
METSPLSIDGWRSRSHSSSSTPVKPGGTGFTHIKRAFYADLVDSRVVDLNMGIVSRRSVSQSQSYETSSPKVQVPSSDDLSEKDDVKYVLENAVLPPPREEEKMEEEDLTVLPRTESPRRMLRFYSGVAASALGGAVVAGLVRQSLGSLIRVVGSGLLVTQLLSVLGYADVRWRKLLFDVCVLGRRTPEIRVVHSVFERVKESAVLKMAFLGGVLGGLFLP